MKFKETITRKGKYHNLISINILNKEQIQEIKSRLNKKGKYEEKAEIICIQQPQQFNEVMINEGFKPKNQFCQQVYYISTTKKTPPPSANMNSGSRLLVFVETKKEILYLVVANKRYGYQISGGNGKDWEMPKETAVRELNEETKFKIDPKNVTELGSVIFFRGDPNRQKAPNIMCTFLYECMEEEMNKQKLIPQLDEVDGCEWVSEKVILNTYNIKRFRKDHNLIAMMKKIRLFVDGGRVGNLGLSLKNRIYY